MIKASACNAGDWVRSLGWEVSLERGMTTHFSILAWKIPWTEEPGELQSMGSQESDKDTTEQLTLSLFSKKRKKKEIGTIIKKKYNPRERNCISFNISLHENLL